MPIYEYRCQDCAELIEEWQKDFIEYGVNCPTCGAKAKRIISNTSFMLKGSGWYVTDYSGSYQGNDKSSNEGSNGKAKNAITDAGTAKASEPSTYDGSRSVCAASCSSKAGPEN